MAGGLWRFESRNCHYIEGLKEFLLRLEQFIQEPIDQHILLYGIDGKFVCSLNKLIIILKLVYMGYF